MCLDSLTLNLIFFFFISCSFNINQSFSDIPNASQIQNTSLANMVHFHNDAVRKMIQSLGTNFVNTSAAEKITDDLKKGKNLILAIMQQLIGKCNFLI